MTRRSAGSNGSTHRHEVAPELTASYERVGNARGFSTILNADSPYALAEPREAPPFDATELELPELEGLRLADAATGILPQRPIYAAFEAARAALSENRTWRPPPAVTDGLESAGTGGIGDIGPGEIRFEGFYIEAPMFPELASQDWIARPWFDDAVHATPAARLDPGLAWDLVHDLRARHPGVVIEPLWEIAFDAMAPSEPAAEGLKGTGDAGAPSDRRWHLGLVHAEAAWQLVPPASGRQRGAGIVVGHLDTGYREHPDLAGLWSPAYGWDVYDDDADAHDDLIGGALRFPGHGTSTASIIGSRGTSEPVMGIAPDVIAIPFRISTSVVHVSMTNMVRGIQLAVKAGVHVISLSAGGLRSAALHRAVRDAIDAGVIVVAAAGNYTDIVVWPARFDEVISCGAVDVNGDLWRHSNGGDGEHVDVLAPGKNVYVLRPVDTDTVRVGAGSGTSFATACVAGAVADWLAFHGRDALVARYGRPNLARIAKQQIIQTKVGGVLNIKQLLEAPLPLPLAFGEVVHPLKSFAVATAAAAYSDEAEFQRLVDQLSRSAPTTEAGLAMATPPPAPPPGRMSARLERLQSPLRTGMSLKREYGGALRKQLGQYPVWDLGTPVAVGDYGTIEDRCFRRLGSLRDLGIDFATTKAPPASWAFTSQRASVVQTRIDGSAGVAGPSVALELGFRDAYSLFIRAADSVVEVMADTAPVFAELRQRDDWRRSYTVVTSARFARSFSIVMNTSTGRSVSIRADPGLLADVLGGRIGGDAGLDIQGDVGLASFGIQGAIYVELSRLKLIGGFELAGAGADQERVPADAPDMRSRVIAYTMHESEQHAARTALVERMETEGYTVGEADDATILALRAQGIIVRELGPVNVKEDEGLASAASDKPVGRKLALTIHEPLDDKCLADLASAGVAVEQRLNPTTIVCVVTKVNPTGVDKLAFVERVEDYPPRTGGMLESFRSRDYEVLATDEGKRVAIEQHLKQQGTPILASGGRKLRATMTDKEVDELYDIEGVLEIDPYVPLELYNDRIYSLVWRAASLQLPLTGIGEIIAVADSGLDQTHPAFAGRIAKCIARGRPNDTTDPHGHGTHVAGTALAAGPQQGLAPEARLVFQSVMDQYGQLTGIPLDLGELFEEAYDEGARIHNNSWGADLNASYTIRSREVDEYVDKRRDMLVVIAAGNAGSMRVPTLGKRNVPAGFVEWGSVGAPATSKNALVVGASRSDRTVGGQSQRTYGTEWPQKFLEPPISAEFVSGDPERMAAFSGRGPSVDRRIKPDLVAPGTDILSARAVTAPTTNFSEIQGQFGYMSGTSMAAPAVAGIAALLRQWLRMMATPPHPRPSAALLKALLIAGTRRLTGPCAIAQHPTLPNYHQGFGAVNLASTIPLDGTFKVAFVDNWEDPKTWLAAGSRRRYAFTTTQSGSLRIVLAYTDPPGRGIQNDLNLMVELPDKSKRQGNESLPNQIFLPDPDNNVEVLRIDNAPAGNYLVQITAQTFLRPNPRQDFALVVSGQLANTALTPQ